MSISTETRLVPWDGGNRSASCITYEKSLASSYPLKENPSGIAEDYKLFYTYLEYGKIDIDDEGGTTKTIKVLAIREFEKKSEEEFEERTEAHLIVALKKDSDQWVTSGRIKNLLDAPENGDIEELAIERGKVMFCIPHGKGEKNWKRMNLPLYFNIRVALKLKGEFDDVQQDYLSKNAPVEPSKAPTSPKKGCCVIL